MKIGGFQKFTLVDYPEKLACTVFFSGCSFRCPWCHNKELVLPEEIRNHPQIPLEEVFEFLKKREGRLEGVVLTGGEPTINPDLPSFCRRVKEMEYNVKLDTNGCNPEMIKKLTSENLIDYVAMDIKSPREKYFQAIGGKIFFEEVDGGRGDFWKNNLLDNIEKSIDFLKEERVEYEFRTTVVPGLLSERDVKKIAKWISPAQRYYLQEFRPAEEVPNHVKKALYEEDFLRKLAKEIEPFFGECGLRKS